MNRTVTRQDYITVRDSLEEVVDIMFEKEWIMSANSQSDAERKILEHMKMINEGVTK